ncbi:hypothetical protein HELRODRAFT_183283 [Helobdella robusta]|uniref:Uncharacterized protein n=1 Tax=Helobdella robusta TaxID=6412 RepID=T1FJE8_HELRO|nr:hypothetical protein HELRODRAFT_183283 [Helobdella robusta]ESO11339.1 hypothetical protein HELRODRAFT_183283 [Helobdella robusta]
MGFICLLKISFCLLFLYFHAGTSAARFIERVHGGNEYLEKLKFVKNNETAANYSYFNTSYDYHNDHNDDDGGDYVDYFPTPVISQQTRLQPRGQVLATRE